MNEAEQGGAGRGEARQGLAQHGIHHSSGEEPTRMKTVVLTNEPTIIIDCWREAPPGSYLVIRRCRCRDGSQDISMFRFSPEAQRALVAFLTQTAEAV
jgi:hypothetical protein